MTLIVFPTMLALIAVNVVAWCRWARPIVADRDDLRALAADTAAQLKHAVQERDSYSDALAAIVDAGDWGGDLASVRDNARFALTAGGYYGRLSAALQAAEEMADQLAAAENRQAAEQMADLAAAVADQAAAEEWL